MFVDCCNTGYCCGYRKDKFFGGVSYQEDEEIPPDVKVEKRGRESFVPVDAHDVCVHLERLDNGFTRCGIHDRKPRMCDLYNCLTEKKVVQIQTIVEHLKGECE